MLVLKTRKSHIGCALDWVGGGGGVEILHVDLKLKGEYASNVRYTVVSLTTVRRETCFSHSERFVTLLLVTSRISREGRCVRAYNDLKFTDDVRDSAPLRNVDVALSNLKVIKGGS